MRRVIPLSLICAIATAETGFVDAGRVEERLKADPAVLVNAQGLAQHDLSIRGSAYTGAGLSLNGATLRAPWSAHHHADLPLLNHLLGAPEVHRGVANATGHLIGTAAYETSSRDREQQLSAGAGSAERYRATAYGSGGNVGAFADWEKARRIDYDPNDLDRFTGGGFLRFYKNDWMLDVLAASQSKRFGANGYYGAPANVEAEQQIDDGLLFASALKGDTDDSFFRATGHYRDTRDQYVLPGSAFENDVSARNLAVALDGRTIEVQHIALRMRGELDHERVSGDASLSRTRGAFLIQPEARFERFAFKAGLNSVFQTDESAEWLPVAGVDWFAGDNSVVNLSYTETERRPDAESLYYADPYRVGDATLSQQRARNAEIGFHQFLSAALDWRAAAFYRRVENATDWVSATPGGVWNATNLGDLDMGGVDAEITYRPTPDLLIRGFYQWMKKDAVDVYAGLYELDYPDHMVNLQLWWRFVNELALECAQTTRWQTENRARTSGDFGADATLGLHYFPRYANNVRLSFLVENLWSSDFQAIPGLEPRPTSVFAGLAVDW